MKFIFSILLFIPYILYSQNILYGKVIDEQTNESVPFASVYINRTTFGTITSVTGAFCLKDVLFPCELVVSHVSYIVKPVILEGQGDTLVIKLKLRKIEIEEVDVSGTNLRDENYRTFRKWFLGDDYWGQNAKVQNDSALLFENIYDTKTVFVKNKQEIPVIKFYKSHLEDFKLSEDSSYYTYSDLASFIVKSKAPLIIELPLLGYTIQFDMIYSTVQKTNSKIISAYIGYYHFKPMIPKNRREEKRFNKNRKLVYYNSYLHFSRSLYSNSLDLNGYRIFNGVQNGGRVVNNLVSLDTCLIVISENMKGVVGLKDRIFSINYYPGKSGEPKVILESRDEKYINSQISFLKDTCYVRSDGTLPDLSIMFTGSIGDKKIGTMLPGDYVPEEQLKILTK